MEEELKKFLPEKEIQKVLEYFTKSNIDDKFIPLGGVNPSLLCSLNSLIGGLQFVMMAYPDIIIKEVNEGTRKYKSEPQNMSFKEILRWRLASGLAIIYIYSDSPHHLMSIDPLLIYALSSLSPDILSSPPVLTDLEQVTEHMEDMIASCKQTDVCELFSIITDAWPELGMVFNHVSEETVECKRGCGYQKVTVNNDVAFSLGLDPDIKSINIMELFIRNMETSKISDFHCQQCLKNGDSKIGPADIKHRKIKNSANKEPEVLIFNIERTTFVNGRPVKLSVPIDVMYNLNLVFPEREKPPVPGTGKKYSLIALLRHKGFGAQSGHYICSLFNHLTNDAFVLNDENVIKGRQGSSPDDAIFVAEKDANMMWYMRKDVEARCPEGIRILRKKGLNWVELDESLLIQVKFHKNITEKQEKKQREMEKRHQEQLEKLRKQMRERVASQTESPINQTRYVRERLRARDVLSRHNIKEQFELQSMRKKMEQTPSEHL